MVLNNMKKILNGIEIELTSEEIAQRLLDEQKAIQERIEFNNKIEQDQIKKQSAIAKLKALGLDEEEIKSLLGV
jgi:hypothetical protein